MRLTILFGLILCIAWSAQGQGVDDAQEFPTNYVPSGKVMFRQFCASCHGMDGRGQGPMAMALKVPPANLTTLAQRHGGKFPYKYVAGVLRFGTGATILHGSSDMPVWGPIFEYMDKNNEASVQQRIRNISNYLASLQER